MTEPVLVTGGTGRLGRHVVEELRARDRQVRVLSRQRHDPQPGVEFVTGDLTNGDGLEAALKGVHTVVHCASSKKGDAAATRRLIPAAAAAGIRHLVYISLVGADSASWGYTKVKLESEQTVTDSGIPWTLQRASQFFELILGGARRLGKLPVIPVPAGFPTQPVDPRDVAAKLAGLAFAAPAGRVPDMGGPQVLSFADVMRAYVRATGHPRRTIIQIPFPGTTKIREGSLLPAGNEVITGDRTWEQFLAEQYPPS